MATLALLASRLHERRPISRPVAGLSDVTTTPETAPVVTTQRGSILEDPMLGLVVGALWISVEAAFELAGCAHDGFGSLTTSFGLVLVPAALIDLVVSGVLGPRFRPRVSLAGFPLLVVLHFGQYATHAARDVVLARTLQNANPIAAAVDTLEREQQRWPRTLDELVPSTLPAIPPTGLSWAPKFDYVAPEVAPDDPGFLELSVDYPIGPFRFDKYSSDPAHDGLPARLVQGS